MVNGVSAKPVTLRAAAATCVAFQAAPATKTCGAFRGIATAKCPTLNIRHFGAAIARRFASDNA
jgi:hypothetical protein